MGGDREGIDIEQEGKGYSAYTNIQRMFFECSLKVMTTLGGNVLGIFLWKVFVTFSERLRGTFSHNHQVSFTEIYNLIIPFSNCIGFSKIHPLYHRRTL